MKNVLIVMIAAATLMACSGTGVEEKRVRHGVDLSNSDTTVRVGMDFYNHVNGGWISRTVIPADRGSWGSFDELQLQNDLIIREALLKAAERREYTEGTDPRRAVDFYSSGVDSLRIETEGIGPLKPILNRIDAIAGKNDLPNFLAEEDLLGGDAFFRFSVSPDSKNSNRMAVYLGSGGTGLPERDYYLKPDVKSQETRDRYRQHIVSMLVLTGWDIARSRKSAEWIMMIEREFAQATLTKEDRRDPVKQYNKRSIADLSTLFPSFRWQSYLMTMGVREDSVIVTEPGFLRECERVVSGFPLEEIKAYLRWTMVRQAAPYLSHDFVREDFAFHGAYLQGAMSMIPRWQRVVEVLDRYIGDATGKLYVAVAFPPEAKKKAMEMVENIRFAFAGRIKQIDWMSDSTKKKALRKLQAIRIKIGYPDQWKKYSGLMIGKGDKSSYYGNVLHASRYEVMARINTLGKPVDKATWEITPQTVNAYYNAPFNEIVFPAGILQPPFYDFRADEAVNYGAIGGVIGHEISHSFDDQGSQCDAEGNLTNWWGQADLRNFKARGNALVSQFNRYQPLPGLSLQGEYTLGENIADLGGLNAAYDGFLRHLIETNTSPEPIDGLTARQRFFMAWATVWRVKYRDEALRTQVLTNMHAPEKFRVNGPVSNMPSFYESFAVKAGDPMFRDEKERVTIW